jgi:hypothetical protein
MGEIVNLRQIRKRRERDAKAAAAAENRVRHGRTGAQKDNDRRAEARRIALLDGARTTPDEPAKS